MVTSNLYEAKTSFSKLVALAMVEGMTPITGDWRLSQQSVSVPQAQ
jgi:hypothetical protein